MHKVAAAAAAATATSWVGGCKTGTGGRSSLLPLVAVAVEAYQRVILGKCNSTPIIVNH